MALTVRTLFMLSALLTVATMASSEARVIQPHQHAVREASKNISCILVFGDSSVDPGNNNRLSTIFKANFPPYGENFFDGIPTGRFTNGRLPTDFNAEAIGHRSTLPAFLDPNLKKEDLLHGVSFASAGSGFDDLTANLTNVLPVAKQIEYLMHYKLQLRELVGKLRAEEIVGNALFVLSMGTNDFIQNYYSKQIRSKQFSVEEYQDYLIRGMTRFVKRIHYLGARRLVVVGLAPLGCLPLIKTLMKTSECVDSLNKASTSMNSKYVNQITILSKVLRMEIFYDDIYTIFQKVMKNPRKYGLAVTSRGCCGSGRVEFGHTCEGKSTCKDPSKYMFWDAVHPTESMYKIIADGVTKMLNDYMLA
ncbi:hypothetical protein Syun_008623 [Stephania yunnanensis]|uniref:GDSL esterase/lipase n=1 Tax=Stephania yunnanensis TaxID=152371 RepID=A0AAP0KF33_9MAGN